MDRELVTTVKKREMKYLNLINRHSTLIKTELEERNGKKATKS